jgi:methyltransferase-like protein
VSERPVVSPVARMMAQQGAQVTNMRHQPVTIGDFDRQVLPALDGSQTRTTLRSRLLEAFRSGQINLAKSGQPVREEHQARAILTATIDEQLQKYAGNALLIG